MPFGSRKFLGSGGPYRVPTIIRFSRAHGGSSTPLNMNSMTISNDDNGNTVLGNGSYLAQNNLRTTVGTGYSSNVPMNCELTAGRVYTIKITECELATTISGGPDIDDFGDDEPTLTLHYGYLTRLANLPELYADDFTLRIDDYGADQVITGSNPYTHTFNFNPYRLPADLSTDLTTYPIDFQAGMIVDSTHNNLHSGGSVATAKGLSVSHSIQNTGSGNGGNCTIEVTEGYF